MLSAHAIRRITGGEEGLPNVHVQVLNIKSAQSENPSAAGAQPRSAKFKLQITDGAEVLTAMLATQYNALLESQELREYSVISIDKYLLNDVKGQKILILLEMHVVAQQSGPLVPVTSAAQSFQPVSVAQAAAPSNYQAAPRMPYQPQQQQQPQQMYASAPAAQPSFQQQQPRVNNPYQAAVSSHAPPASMYGTAPAPYNPQINRAPVIRTAPTENLIPIAGLNPYMPMWKFKARITNKSDIKSWNNARGTGTLFSIDMLDSDQSEIRGTFFKEQCERFYPQLEVNHTYTFSGGSLKPANKKFSNLANDYEISFDNKTIIEPCADSGDIKTQKYAFVKLAAIASVSVESVIDVLGIVRSFGEVQEITSKTSGKQMKKRDVTITDDSGFDIRVTLWGDKGNVDLYLDPICILAVKGAKVGDYQGRTLGTLSSSVLTINPDLEEAHELYKWRESLGGDLPVAQSMSSAGGGRDDEGIEKRSTLSIYAEGRLGLGDKPDYISVKGSVTFVKHDQDEGPWYCACPECNKKVVQGMGDTWQCEKCNRDYERCSRRYILTLSVADHTGTQWVTLFDEHAQQLLGHTAEELYQMKINGDTAAFNKVFADVNFKQIMLKLRVKQEMVNDEPRLKSQGQSYSAVDFAKESKQLLLAISKYD